MSQPEYMTLGEAQRELGVSHVTIARMVRDGTLPSVPNKLDRRSKLVRRADVEALKRQGRPAEYTPRKELSAA
jgi:excisionase family DNA binding protein